LYFKPVFFLRTGVVLLAVFFMDGIPFIRVKHNPSSDSGHAPDSVPMKESSTESRIKPYADRNVEALRSKKNRIEAYWPAEVYLSPLLQPFQARAVCVLFVCLFVFLSTDFHRSAQVDGRLTYKQKTPFLLGFFNKNRVT